MFLGLAPQKEGNKGGPQKGRTAAHLPGMQCPKKFRGNQDLAKTLRLEGEGTGPGVAGGEQAEDSMALRPSGSKDSSAGTASIACGRSWKAQTDGDVVSLSSPCRPSLRKRTAARRLTLTALPPDCPAVWSRQGTFLAGMMLTPQSLR